MNAFELLFTGEGNNLAVILFFIMVFIKVFVEVFIRRRMETASEPNEEFTALLIGNVVYRIILYGSTAALIIWTPMSVWIGWIVAIIIATVYTVAKLLTIVLVRNGK